jgi:hypothetical protein
MPRRPTHTIYAGMIRLSAGFAALLLMVDAAAAQEIQILPGTHGAEQARVLCESLAEKASRQAGEAQPGAVYKRELGNCVAQFQRNLDLIPGARSRVPSVRDLVPSH